VDFERSDSEWVGVSRNGMKLYKVGQFR